jgi:type IV pilus assembly protein PilC
MSSSYHYTAINKLDKSMVNGTIRAENELSAREKLRSLSLITTNLKEIKTAKIEDAARPATRKQLSPAMEWINSKLSTIGLKEKILFTQNLAIMIRAGIPITECLLYMESYMENYKFKKLLNTLRLDILGGLTLSRAMDKHPEFFDSIYVSIVQAGEASGELENVLNRLTKLLQDQAALKKKIVAALTYPVILVFIISIVLAVMFIFVIPTFASMYEQMGVTLPLITQAMISISNFIRSFWYISIAMMVAGGFAFKQYISTSFGRMQVDGLLLKIPVVKTLVTAVSSSHFISTLHISFGAGLPITECMFMAVQTVTNSVIKAAFEEANIKIQSGQRIAAALAESKVLPGMVLIMLSTGEEAGSLEAMMDNSLHYLEGEVNQRVDILMSMMEPLLMLVIGVIVGAMALSIYLPLFGMYEHIS